MPLIELEPPSTLPPGHMASRPLSEGSGSLMYIQLKRGLRIALISPAGTRSTGAVSKPPPSSSRTLFLRSAESRCASTHPAEPAPTMM